MTKLAIMERRYYETTFLFLHTLSQEQKENLVSRYVAFLKEHKAEIVYQKKLTYRKLAYPIKKNTSTMEQTIEFLGNPSVVAKLEKQYKQNEHILRFLTVCLDKHAIKFKQQQRAYDEKKL